MVDTINVIKFPRHTHHRLGRLLVVIGNAVIMVSSQIFSFGGQSMYAETSNNGQED